MTDQSTFELKLGALFGAYADSAPVEVDAAELAATIVARQRGALILGRWSLPSNLTARLLMAGLLLALLGAAAVVGARMLLEAPPPPRPYDNVLVPLGQLSERRISPLVAELPDGRVLIAGGFGDAIPAEIFDPATGTSEVLDGLTPTGERGSSVPLPDGKLLMIAHNGNFTDSRAWVFDPASESFQEIDAPGPANAPAFGVRPGVAALGDGRVLVAGGTNDAMAATPYVLASAMLFDPVSQTFSPTGSMSIPRVDHSMTTLPDGRVLIAGGWAVWPERLGISQYLPGQPTASTEIYDPDTGSFTPTASMTSVTGPNMAVALPDGRVLVMSAPVERSDGLPPRPPVAMDIYDPITGTFTALPQLSLAIRDAVILRDGRVLLSGSDQREWSQPDPQGGIVSGPFDVPWSAIYDPADGTVTQVPPRSASNPGIVSLRDGNVLFAGGWSWAPPGGEIEIVTSVELFR